MCGHRGLESESDLQTYEVALTTQFREQYDRVLGPLRAERAENTAQVAFGGGPGSQQRGRTITPIIVKPLLH